MEIHLLVACTVLSPANILVRWIRKRVPLFMKKSTFVLTPILCAKPKSTNENFALTDFPPGSLCGMADDVRGSPRMWQHPWMEALYVYESTSVCVGEWRNTSPVRKVNTKSQFDIQLYTNIYSVEPFYEVHKMQEWDDVRRVRIYLYLFLVSNGMLWCIS